MEYKWNAIFPSKLLGFKHSQFAAVAFAFEIFLCQSFWIDPCRQGFFPGSRR